MGKPRMQTSGTGRKTDASYHLEKQTTSLVNRQGGFEGVSILKTPQFFILFIELQLVFAVAQDCDNFFIGLRILKLYSKLLKINGCANF